MKKPPKRKPLRFRCWIVKVDQLSHFAVNSESAAERIATSWRQTGWRATVLRGWFTEDRR